MGDVVKDPFSSVIVTSPLFAGWIAMQQHRFALFFMPAFIS